MSSSAIPQVVAFLTRPLIAEFATAIVSSAQVILSASLATQPCATFVLNAASAPPAPIFAASIGAGIPWAAWMAKLGSGEILLFYGPGFVKVRVGNAAVTDVWTEETQGSIVPISRAQMKVGPSPLLQATTGARLRAMLLSARVRSMRRHQAAEPIRIPSLLACADSDSSDSDSDSDYAESDSASSTSSKFTSYSNDSLTSAGSPPTTPAKSVPIVLPSVAKYRAPRPSTIRAPAPAPAPARAPVKRSPAPPARPNEAKKDTTAYLYQGGVTRVMTGGVMLGPRHVVRATRS
ncbi:hypothetical protein B0H16DRAFT_1567137 [Mycena metata]|uniref:Uncharacterized protein n=1 Tax=Mycena metata TaxID=1033252 RepID=A0AAD7N0J6_9AGAR|nr:hypothetical protein B0H16DRAFT_1567137 [Mycena metata]